MSDINCPYCNAELNICHDDGHGYSEDARHEQECEYCEKTFVYNTFISFSYRPYKADCLNGAPHRLEKTKTWPEKFARMACLDCDHEEPIRAAAEIGKATASAGGGV